MTNLETTFFQILTREAVRCCSKGVRLFSGPARTNAYGSYNLIPRVSLLPAPKSERGKKRDPGNEVDGSYSGLSSMVLQKKGSQGRTGQMIKHMVVVYQPIDNKVRR